MLVFTFRQTVEMTAVHVSIVLHHWNNWETPHRSTSHYLQEKVTSFLTGNRLVNENNSKMIQNMPWTPKLPQRSNLKVGNSKKVNAAQIHSSHSKTWRCSKATQYTITNFILLMPLSCSLNAARPEAIFHQNLLKFLRPLLYFLGSPTIQFDLVTWMW